MGRGEILTHKLCGIKIHLTLKARWDLKALVLVEKGSHQKELEQAHLILSDYSQKRLRIYQSHIHGLRICND